MFASKDIFLKSSGGYTISRSVRLRSSASAYFNRTPSVIGNRKTFTWSGWVKIGQFGVASNPLFGAIISGTSNVTEIAFDASNRLDVFSQNTAGTVIGRRTTTQVFRDPSAWYHIVVAIDTSDATASNRIKLYVNGNQITSFAASTDFALNDNTGVNDTTVQRVGARASGTYFFDGYLTEVNFIDGQALTPSSFGETNAVTGVWQPKRYAGTYGTNGFYLNFSDNSGVTATTIGKDYSGNGNNWTPSAGISITAGATYDSMLDSPTLYADGGNGRGNYCTLNPLNKNSVITLSAGNLSFTASNNRFTTGTFAVTSGKWYWEFYPVAGGASGVGVGAISATTYVFGTAAFSTAAGYIGVGYTSNGSKYISGTSSAYGATYGSGNVIGVALDLDSGTKTITFYKDNISQGSINLPTSSEAWIVATDYSEAGTHSINFGQRPFTYTPPTGFVALNTQNLPTPTISNGATVMAATTYTGNGTTQSISNAVNGVSFQPDFVWFKNRTGANNHALYDSVRGRALGLISNATNAEQSASAGNDLVSFDSNGVSLGPVEDFTSVNGSAQSIVAWQWKEGATQGFDIVPCTSNGSGIITSTAHSLNVLPSMIILKARTGTEAWYVYHKNSTAIATQGTLNLNTTSAVNTTNGTSGGVDKWTVSSSAFAAGNAAWTYQVSTNYIAYLFAAVAGYSAFGSYTGNGVPDGPFVYLGFRPRFIMWKNASAVEAWLIEDTARSTYNEVALELYPSSSGAEAAGSSRSPTQQFDYLSNGFKVRGAQSQTNGSGNTIIYAAFAENPFKHSLAR